MDNKISKKERTLSCYIYAFFILYIVFLLRITLFKQAPMYNLFAAIGASERTISIIPFKSIFDMISTDVSLMRILENVFGNIIIFIPKKTDKYTQRRMSDKGLRIVTATAKEIKDVETDIFPKIPSNLLSLEGFYMCWSLQAIPLEIC